MGAAAAACGKSGKKVADQAEKADAGTATPTAAAEPTEKPAPAPAGIKGPQKLHGMLTPQQVTGLTYQAGDKNIPHPFYTPTECRKVGKSGTYMNAKGNGVYTYDPSKQELAFEITYSGLSGSPVMVHLRKGGDGDAGPIVQSLCGRPPPNSEALGFSPPPVVSKDCAAGDSGVVKGVYKVAGNPNIKPPLTADEEGQLLVKDGMYVLIATCLNQIGELRGQIMHD
jgi:hypothetical protein